MRVDTVIYHAACWDGFCAAWLLHKHFQDATYIPAHYGEDPPWEHIDNKSVMIVDFSYKRPVMEEIARRVFQDPVPTNDGGKYIPRIIVLDHHKTAEKELQGLPYALFDMNVSGARMTETWMVEHGYLDPFEFNSHWLVQYTQDRDLWEWKLPNSKEINAYLRTFKLDFSVWDHLSLMSPDNLVVPGTAILSYQQSVVDSHVKNAIDLELQVGNTVYTVKAVNATTLVSEICGELAKDMPFGATFFVKDTGEYVWSLRSRDDGVDVSEIARYFGGGGHRNAAGFTSESVPPSPFPQTIP